MLLGVAHVGDYARLPGSSRSAQREAPLLGSLCSPLPAELVETLPGVHLCLPPPSATLLSPLLHR